MIIFDTLGQLESYVPLYREVAHIISVLDRSLPYKDPDGHYEVKENKKMVYDVKTSITSPKGEEIVIPEGKKAMIIALEGEESVSAGIDAVFTLCEGRFILLGEGTYKRYLSQDATGFVRDVVFYF